MISALLLAAAIIPAGQTFECTPTRVWDGDGPVWCAEGPRVRLSGVAAREMDGSCKQGHPCPASDPINSRDGLVRLMQSFAVLLKSGARVELRTVVLSDNLNDFPALSRFVATHLGFCIQWSVMQLENIGFAKNRFTNLYVDHEQQFASIAEAIDVAVLYGMPVSLFNFARCSVPKNYRDYAVASISDWKRKFPLACNTCSEQAQCSGFFEWHPEAMAKVTPL